MKKTILLVSMSISLFGCGSDDSRPGVKPGIPSPPNTPTTPNIPKPPTPPTDTVEPPVMPDGTVTDAKILPGIYTGTSTWVTGKQYVISGLVDDSKRLWFINSESEDSEILGFANSNESIKGTNGEFSVKGVEYSYDDLRAIDITIEGNYKNTKIVEGKTFALPSSPTTYKVQYDDRLSAEKQTLNSINGKVFKGEAYLTGDEGKGIVTLSFVNKGDFTGSDIYGCTMKGKLTLAGSGRYFNASLNFTNSKCLANGETHSGVALLNDNNELIILGTNGGKNRGVIFDGEEY